MPAVGAAWHAASEMTERVAKAAKIKTIFEPRPAKGMILREAGKGFLKRMRRTVKNVILLLVLSYTYPGFVLFYRTSNPF
jgi:hypothetical protein